MTERWLRELERIDSVQPSAGLLERAKDGPHPDLRTGRRVHRLTAAVVALLVAVAGGGVAYVAFTPAGVREHPPVGTGSYTDPSAGWTIHYPTGWYVTPIDLGLTIFVKGAMFSNAPLPQPTVSSGPRVWTFRHYPPNMAQLPRDAVVLAVTHTEGGPMIESANDSSFPLSWSHAKNARTLTFRANGLAYVAKLWVGDSATKANVSAAERAVSTITFPHPESADDQLFEVIGTHDEYPVGTVKLFALHRPHAFFLVHVPAGFYALKLENFGHAKPSAFSYDPGTREILYGDLSWNLRGQPTTTTTGRRPFPSLRISPVIRAWDGHLLVDALTLTSRRAALGIWR